jgi:excisionase family DNA binding protein
MTASVLSDVQLVVEALKCVLGAPTSTPDTPRGCCADLLTIVTSRSPVDRSIYPGAHNLRKDKSVSSQSSMPRDRLLTVAEVADHMRVSSMTVYRLIKAGSLKAVRVGKNYRIRTGDLDAYLQSSSISGNGAERA